jgi:UDP-glucose-4-epimerase GalE
MKAAVACLFAPGGGEEGLAMRVLVTGGSGYIGTHTVRALLEAGHQPFIFDLREPPGAITGAGVEWLVGDVRSDRDLDSALAQGPFDGVLHLAAEKSIAASLEDPERFMEVNVEGTGRVVDAAVRGRIASIVLSSSCAVYGTPDRLPVDESTPLQPENPYGLSKQRAENLLDDAARDHGIRCMALRYFNAAGAADDGRTGEDWRGATNLLPVAIEAALGRAPAMDVYGADHDTPDGTAIRDYVHVVDLAEAHLAALAALGRGSGVRALNLGTGRGTSVREVLEEVGRAVGRAVPHRVVARRPGEASAVWADPSAAEAELGWEARFGFKEIVATAVTWHLRANLTDSFAIR